MSRQSEWASVQASVRSFSRIARFSLSYALENCIGSVKPLIALRRLLARRRWCLFVARFFSMILIALMYGLRQSAIAQTATAVLVNLVMLLAFKPNAPALSKPG